MGDIKRERKIKKKGRKAYFANLVLVVAVVKNAAGRWIPGGYNP